MQMLLLYPAGGDQSLTPLADAGAVTGRTLWQRLCSAGNLQKWEGNGSAMKREGRKRLGGAKWGEGGDETVDAVSGSGNYVDAGHGRHGLCAFWPEALGCQGALDGSFRKCGSMDVSVRFLLNYDLLSCSGGSVVAWLKIQ